MSNGAIAFSNTQNIEILALHQALEKFAALDLQAQRRTQIFGNSLVKETEKVLDLSTATIECDSE